MKKLHGSKALPMSLWQVAGLAVAAGAVLSVIVYALVLGIGPVPTSSAVRKHLAEMLPNEATRVIELGCGWGTLLHILSRRYPKGVIVAYERSPVPWLLAWLASLFLPNVYVSRRNFFHLPLSDADLIVCYLCPKLMQRLSEKFRTELRAGTWIVSHTFALPDWAPERLTHANDLYQTPIHRYRATGRATIPKVDNNNDLG